MHEVFTPSPLTSETRESINAYLWQKGVQAFVLLGIVNVGVILGGLMFVYNAAASFAEKEAVSAVLRSSQINSAQIKLLTDTLHALEQSGKLIGKAEAIEMTLNDSKDRADKLRGEIDAAIAILGESKAGDSLEILNAISNIKLAGGVSTVVALGTTAPILNRLAIEGDHITISGPVKFKSKIEVPEIVTERVDATNLVAKRIDTQEENVLKRLHVGNGGEGIYMYQGDGIVTFTLGYDGYDPKNLMNGFAVPLFHASSSTNGSSKKLLNIGFNK